MENKMEIFKNEQFGEIRTVEIEDKIYFCGSDVAKALGYVRPNDAISAHCRATVKCSTPISGKMQDINFIPEGDVYRLITHSKLPEAEKFESWVFDEVLPSIRKHGLYAVDELIANPELAIAAFTALKEEREKNALLTHENGMLTETVAEQKKEIEHKEDVIIGLVDDIDLATKRQRINQIIRYHTRESETLSKRWSLLYSEFEKKYHVNLSVRLENYKDSFTPKLKNKLDVIDRQMEMIPQLYEVCCKLFENDVKILIEEWECTIAC